MIMEKEKEMFVETHLAQIFMDVRASILENARLEISEAKATVAEYIDYLARQGEEYAFYKTIAGISKSTGEKIIADHKAGKDFGECLEEITPAELLEFIGVGRLKMASMRARYPNAFRPWTHELDAELEKMWCAGASYAELSEKFGRNENALKVRVVRLELEDKYGARPEGRLDVKMRY